MQYYCHTTKHTSTVDVQRGSAMMPIRYHSESKQMKEIYYVHNTHQILNI